MCICFNHVVQMLVKKIEMGNSYGIDIGQIVMRHMVIHATQLYFHDAILVHQHQFANTEGSNDGTRRFSKRQVEGKILSSNA